MELLAELIGNSPAIRAVRKNVHRLLGSSEARRLPPILIVGETGTGKGLLARAIHDASARRGGPFVDVSAAAIPDSLLESELFGFDRGAFTDARQPKMGLFQAAHHGTMFLDEIGLLPVTVQGKLLKVIEERTVRRLGGTRTEPVDISLITASNEDLTAAIREQRFRGDLFYRLAVVTLELPPLRERGADIELLAEVFLASACKDYGLPPKTLAADARAALTSYRWPGNVRELRNLIERATLLAQADELTAPMLGLPAADADAPEPRPRRTVRLGELVEALERHHVVEALDRTRWNVSRAAVELGVTRNVLRYRMKQYGLHRQQPRGAAVRRRIAAPAEASTLPSPAPAATQELERRRLAFLRVDLAAPSSAWTVVELVADKAESLGGRVDEAGVSQVVAIFGLEPAAEDAARRAAVAALAIQHAAEEVAGESSVKIALHIEEVGVTRVGGVIHADADAKRRISRVLEALVSRATDHPIVASQAAVLLLDRRFDFATADGPPRRYRVTPGSLAETLAPLAMPGA